MRFRETKGLARHFRECSSAGVKTYRRKTARPSNIPFTQLDVLSQCVREDARGLPFCPKGADAKRAHALVRRGLIEVIGHVEDHFRPTAAGRALYPTAYRPAGEA